MIVFYCHYTDLNNGFLNWRIRIILMIIIMVFITMISILCFKQMFPSWYIISFIFVLFMYMNTNFNFIWKKRLKIRLKIEILIFKFIGKRCNFYIWAYIQVLSIERADFFLTYLPLPAAIDFGGVNGANTVWNACLFVWLSTLNAYKRYLFICYPE